MARPPVEETPPTHPEPVINETEGSKPITPPEDALDIPEADPLKTMYVSDAEMLAELGRDKADEPEIIEIAPIEEAPPAEDKQEEPEPEPVVTPEPPKFSVPDIPAPSFQDFGPPPSPFSPSGGVEDTPVPPPPPIDDRKPVSSVFNEAETMIQPKFASPFDSPPPPAAEKPPEPVAEWKPPGGPDLGKSPFDPQPSAPVAAWTPPPAPEANWENKEVGANTPLQPPPAGGGVDGQSKGLAIGSLVAGILSCLCCFSPITGPVAIVTGFLARKKADEDPTQYGGKGLATVGMITGVLGFLAGVILIILQIAGALDGIINSIVREF